MRWIEKNKMKVGIVLGVQLQNDIDVLSSNPNQGPI
jgi:hypothetical protein